MPVHWLDLPYLCVLPSKPVRVPIAAYFLVIIDLSILLKPLGNNYRKPYPLDKA
jgi:hypothetical protein